MDNTTMVELQTAFTAIGNFRCVCHAMKQAAIHAFKAILLLTKHAFYVQMAAILVTKPDALLAKILIIKTLMVSVYRVM